MKYKIEISDEYGNTCRFKLTVPFFTRLTDLDNSSWKALDAGYIKYRTGNCIAAAFAFNPVDLWLCRGSDNGVISRGIILYKFTDSFSIVNDSGSGKIFQWWCVNFVPYQISWELM